MIFFYLAGSKKNSQDIRFDIKEKTLRYPYFDVM
jgi:hypothetical protein